MTDTDPYEPVSKPYYQDDFVTIYNTECTQWFGFMSDDEFDVILTDPPYNEVNRAGAKHRDGSEWYGMDKGGADSLEVDVPTLAHEFARIASQWVYVFCGWKQVSEFLREFEDSGMSIRLGGWHKASPVPVAASLNWLNTFETCAIGRHPKASFHGFTEDPIWWGEKEHSTIHPTQKPLWLMKKILAACSDDISSTGGKGRSTTVLDPFMGSGSTLEAAKSLGMKAVGIEINEEYCERAANRLSQDTLF